MWNYTEINEKYYLPAGNGANWTKRGEEKLGAACEYYITMVMMGDAYRVPPCGWEYPTLKSASELQKLFEAMGLVIVKTTSTFTAF